VPETGEIAHPGARRLRLTAGMSRPRQLSQPRQLSRK
jgi:hypothetical protein